jgi:hypothetical protein
MKILPTLLILGALVVAGCGSTSTSTTTSSSAAKTSNDDDGPQTLKGAVGDALALQGSGLNDDPNDHTKTKVKVKLTAVRGPFKGFDIPSDHKLVGVVLQIANVGQMRYSDPLPDGVLTLDSGKPGKQTSLIAVGRPNPCANPSLKLDAGESKRVCIAYEIPKRATPRAFKYVTDSGYGDTGQWSL